MNIALWLVAGAALGWCATCIARADKHDSLFLNVIVGVVGALLGGATAIRHREFSAEALLMAVIGATLLLLVVNVVQKRIRDVRKRHGPVV
jgi:uncharacterized membrane protein YeaQ/YmgE (transglycosylase-associated protein family)